MHRATILVAALLFGGSGCGTSPAPISRGKSVEHWLEASTDADPKVRVEAIKKLGNIGNKAPAALPTVFEALADPSPAVRKEAIYAIVRNRQASSKAIHRFEDMKENDEDSEIREIAAEAHRNLTDGK